MVLIGSFALFWLTLLAAVATVPGTTMRKLIAPIPALLVLIAAITFQPDMNAVGRLFLAFPAMLFSLKAGLLLARFSAEEVRQFEKLGLLLYMTLWPGFDPAPFRKRGPVTELERGRFIRGYVLMWSGIIAIAILSYFHAVLPAWFTGAAGILALMCTVHLGYCDVLSSLVRWLGWSAAPLFEQPWRSSSLRDFWNKRWNIAFVEMNRQVFMPLFKRSTSVRTAVVLAFLLSGALHEFAISYPAAGGYGGPMLYFVIQAIACLAEPRLLKLCGANRSKMVGRIWTWLVLLLPAPLLFTPQFMTAIIDPMYASLQAILHSVSIPWLLDKLIWFAAAGNFLTMAAGIQVPKRLNWDQQLGMLTAFNRKIILNYYFYTGGVIAAWGLLTVLLHGEIIAGERAAGLLSAIIAAFWGARVLVDTFWFKHDDWPPGSELIVGHALLTTLFVCLTAAYGFFAIWCLCL